MLGRDKSAHSTQLAGRMSDQIQPRQPYTISYYCKEPQMLVQLNQQGFGQHNKCWTVTRLVDQTIIFTSTY